MRFYLGTHETQWLPRTDRPLFISRRRLERRKNMPVALGAWALDSGGFTELSMYHGWQTSPQEYVDKVRRYMAEIGNMEWASPQDWMCEPPIVAATGLSVTEHQRRTVDNFLLLRSLAPEAPFIPVLQGWERYDYLKHIGMYAMMGVDLTAEPRVGLGSVCRRQATDEILAIVRTMHDEGLKLHGYGVKIAGLKKYGQYLASSDSMAWSFGARLRPRMTGHTHKTCANCMPYAMRWRAKIVLP